jgi:hypothetical protein
MWPLHKSMQGWVSKESTSKVDVRLTFPHWDFPNRIPCWSLGLRERPGRRVGGQSTVYVGLVAPLTGPISAIWRMGLGELLVAPAESAGRGPVYVVPSMTTFLT